MIICVTGHRPNKLYGYNLSDPRWQRLKNQLKSILKAVLFHVRTILANGTKKALLCTTIFCLKLTQ